MKLRLSRRAAADIEEIADYIMRTILAPLLA